MFLQGVAWLPFAVRALLVLPAQERRPPLPVRQLPVVPGFLLGEEDREDFRSIEQSSVSYFESRLILLHGFIKSQKTDLFHPCNPWLNAC